MKIHLLLICSTYVVVKKKKKERNLRLFSTGNNMNSLSGVSCLQLLVQFHLMTG